MEKERNSMTELLKKKKTAEEKHGSTNRFLTFREIKKW